MFPKVKPRIILGETMKQHESFKNSYIVLHICEKFTTIFSHFAKISKIVCIFVKKLK